MDDSKKSFEKNSILRMQKIWCFKCILLTVYLFLKTTVTQNKIKAKLNTPKEQLLGERSCSENRACESKCLELLLSN